MSAPGPWGGWRDWFLLALFFGLCLTLLAISDGWVPS